VTLVYSFSTEVNRLTKTAVFSRCFVHLGENRFEIWKKCVILCAFHRYQDINCDSSLIVIDLCRVTSYVIIIASVFISYGNNKQIKKNWIFHFQIIKRGGELFSMNNF